MQRKWISVSLILVLFIWASGFTAETPKDLVLGEYKVSKVVDGDTIGVDGLPKTVRLLNIDTEESEKGADAEQKTKEIADHFPAYIAEQTKNTPYPKANTPLGWDGTLFARKMFPIGSTIRIEFDDPGRKWDYYGRVLAYVFVKINGRWVNYNVECVRAGLSPYSDKYGPSKRFEYEFIQAEREARVNHRGVWQPGAMCYPDYDGRLKWWNERGNEIRNFDAKYHSRNGSVDVLNDIDWNRMENQIGQEVLLFGSYMNTAENSVPILSMHHNDQTSVGLVFPEPKTHAALAPILDNHKDHMVYFSGTLEPGKEINGANYAYTLSIQSVQQFFYESGAPEYFNKFPVAAAPVSLSPIDFKPLPGTIPWSQATAHVNQEITISGNIIRSKDIGNLTFLNFNEDFSNTITVVIFKKNYDKYPKAPAEMFLNKLVKVHGKVTVFKDKPQIVIEDPKDIEIVGE